MASDPWNNTMTMAEGDSTASLTSPPVERELVTKMITMPRRKSSLAHPKVQFVQLDVVSPSEVRLSSSSPSNAANSPDDGNGACSWQVLTLTTFNIINFAFLIAGFVAYDDCDQLPTLPKFAIAFGFCNFAFCLVVIIHLIIPRNNAHKLCVAVFMLISGMLSAMSFLAVTYAVYDPMVRGQFAWEDCNRFFFLAAFWMTNVLWVAAVMGGCFVFVQNVRTKQPPPEYPPEEPLSQTIFSLI